MAKSRNASNKSCQNLHHNHKRKVSLNRCGRTEWVCGWEVEWVVGIAENFYPFSRFVVQNVDHFWPPKRPGSAHLHYLFSVHNIYRQPEFHLHNNLLTAEKLSRITTAKKNFDKNFLIFLHAFMFAFIETEKERKKILQQQLSLISRKRLHVLSFSIDKCCVWWF